MKFLAALFILMMSPALAQDCIDDELVLLADASYSMFGEPYQIQRDGYAHAFRSSQVVNQIEAGACGAIVVAYVEFGATPHTVVPFTVLRNYWDAERYARAIETAPMQPTGMTTNISAAMTYAIEILHSNEYEGLRRIVDVSSDGIASEGGPPKDVVVMHGSKFTPWHMRVIINGLPIIHRPSDRERIEDYFKNNIVGFGGRLFPATSLENFRDAVTQKIAQELG
jgi:hypothetical protein